MITTNNRNIVFSTKDCVFYLDRELSGVRIIDRGCFSGYYKRILFQYYHLEKQLIIMNNESDTTVLKFYEEDQHEFRLLHKIALPEICHVYWFAFDKKNNKTFIATITIEDPIKVLQLSHDKHEVRVLLKGYQPKRPRIFYDEENHWLIAIYEINYLKVWDGSSETLLHSFRITRPAIRQNSLYHYDSSSCYLFTAVKRSAGYTEPWNEITCDIWNIKTGKLYRSFPLKGESGDWLHPQRIDYDSDLNIIIIQSNNKATFWNPESGRRLTEKEFPCDNFIWDKERMKFIYQQKNDTKDSDVLGFRH